jgi:hypothetical protein
MTQAALLKMLYACALICWRLARVEVSFARNALTRRSLAP